MWKKVVKLLWPPKFEGICDAVKARLKRSGASPGKGVRCTIGSSSAFHTDDDDDGNHDEDEERTTEPS